MNKEEFYIKLFKSIEDRFDDGYKLQAYFALQQLFLNFSNDISESEKILNKESSLIKKLVKWKLQNGGHEKFSEKFEELSKHFN